VRHRILVVAQDVMLRSTLARWLMPAGYSVELAENDRRARDVLAAHPVALTILVRGRSGALALKPDHSCGKWIIVTEQARDTVRSSRCEPAADGCLSIRLDEQEVLASVKSVLQTQPGDENTASRVEETWLFDDFTVDLAGRSLRDSLGNEVFLTRSEFALLVAFVRHPGRVLSRDQLLDAAAAGRRAEPYDRSVDVLVGRLRRKIEPDPKKPRFIVTVQGEGYKFIAKLRDGHSSPQPANGASAKGEEPPAGPQSIERRQITVMSCGLVGSAALAGRLDPEDLRDVISKYRRCCTEVIGRSGGLVTTSPDDRLLVYFGYPVASENDPETAVRAGLALIDALPKLDILASPLHARVGIASGLVLAGGAVLDQAGVEPVAIGEAPSLAAQLQAFAPSDAVMIAASTRQLVRGLFDYREAKFIALEGSAKPVPAWQVVGTSAVESRFEALRGVDLTPLIGRDEELDLLRRRWRQIQSREGRVVLISGEPGIGKSRLIRAS